MYVKVNGFVGIFFVNGYFEFDKVFNFLVEI